MTTNAKPRSSLTEAGFTAVELLVYWVIAVIVVGGAFQLLISQNRLYLKQRELEDVRASLRASANILAFELRQASAFGDPYFISSDSFAIRSLQGAGIICGVHNSNPRVGVWGTTGEFDSTPDDSALVFAAASWGIGDDAWVPASITQIWQSPSSGGVPSCDWNGGGTEPDLALELAGSTPTPPDKASGDIPITPFGTVQPGATVQLAVSYPSLSCEEFDSRVTIKIDADKWVYDSVMNGCTFDVSIPSDADKLHIQINIEADYYPQLSDDIFADAEWKFNGGGGGGGSAQDSILNPVHIGAPLRVFRRVQYGIFEEDDRWWLGRKVGSAASYEKLMGPLQAPAENGLVLTSYDAAGLATTDPTRVEIIDIQLRGVSFGKVRKGRTQPPAAVEDSLRIRVTLRG